MKLSIITINYNNCEGLRKTIESVVNQTWKEFEWIIVDGGSTDGSKELIEEIATTCTNISYWCSEQDGGIYAALNKSLGFARGEYVSFLNSGDSYCNNYVLQSVFSTEQSADILYGNAIFFNEEKSWHVRYPEKLSLNWVCKESINHQATFTHRSVFEKITFDLKYKVVADRKFWMQCMLYGFSFQHLDIDVALYDHTGFSTKQSSVWKAEQQKIYNEIIVEGVDIDLKRSEELTFYEWSNDIKSAAVIIRQGGLISLSFIAVIRLFLRISKLFS